MLWHPEALPQARGGRRTPGLQGQRARCGGRKRGSGAKSAVDVAPPTAGVSPQEGMLKVRNPGVQGMILKKPERQFWFPGDLGGVRQTGDVVFSGGGCESARPRALSPSPGHTGRPCFLGRRRLVSGRQEGRARVPEACSPCPGVPLPFVTGCLCPQQPDECG